MDAPTPIVPLVVKLKDFAAMVGVNVSTARSWIPLGMPALRAASKSKSPSTHYHVEVEKAMEWLRQHGQASNAK